MHYAVQEKSNDIIKLLLNSGAYVNVEDDNGNTPLWRAVFDYDGDKEIIKTLLKYGANKQHSNKHGVSIKELVEESGDLNELF